MGPEDLAEIIAELNLDQSAELLVGMDTADDAGGVMLGCSSQTMDVGAGDKTAIGGALVRMPLAQLKKVASYRITYYEDHEDIGKR